MGTKRLKCNSCGTVFESTEYSTLERCPSCTVKGFNIPPRAVNTMKQDPSEGLKGLWTEVAKIAYTAITQELGTNVPPRSMLHNTELYANTCAKVSFDFADAFMEERAKRLADQALKVKL